MTAATDMLYVSTPKIPRPAVTSVDRQPAARIPSLCAQRAKKAHGTRAGHRMKMHVFCVLDSSMSEHGLARVVDLSVLSMHKDGHLQTT